MFENCDTLAALNAERVRLSATMDLAELNNAYKKHREEIQQQRANYTRVKFYKCVANPVVKYCGVPVCGRSDTPGVIKLTQEGFLF